MYTLCTVYSVVHVTPYMVKYRYHLTKGGHYRFHTHTYTHTHTHTHTHIYIHEYKFLFMDYICIVMCVIVYNSVIL